VINEPTTDLHLADIERHMGIVKTLVSRGNSLIVIEHNLDVIWQADWVIDIGPDGGNNGGFIVAQGIPEEVVNCEESYTGNYLIKLS